MQHLLQKWKIIFHRRINYHNVQRKWFHYTLNETYFPFFTLQENEGFCAPANFIICCVIQWKYIGGSSISWFGEAFMLKVMILKGRRAYNDGADQDGRFLILIWIFSSNSLVIHSMLVFSITFTNKPKANPARRT